jgi:23S rRNA-/tRNA-specific pseudouridylate synthase
VLHRDEHLVVDKRPGFVHRARHRGPTLAGLLGGWGDGIRPGMHRLDRDTWDCWLWPR